MQQLELDNILGGSENALTDRQPQTLAEKIEQAREAIVLAADGKQRLKFVNGKTPHFKPYEGDKNNG